MHLHIVSIPAANVAEDAPLALERGGIFTMFEGEGDIITRALVTLPDDMPDPVTWAAELGAGIAAQVRTGLRTNDPVLVLGGNCNALVGVLAGFEGAFGADARIGLVWFDAHGDFNTPKTTLTGRLGGMPVAVSAGLAYSQWRATTGLTAPIPTNRIVMVDVRNLDPKERTLIEATDVTIVAVSDDYPAASLTDAVTRLAAECEVIYLHVDEDILDRRFVPNHGTAEPDGPDIPTVQAAIRTVFATGKVRALGLVSIYLAGEGSETSLSSARELLTESIHVWRTVPHAVDTLMSHNDT